MMEKFTKKIITSKYFLLDQCSINTLCINLTVMDKFKFIFDLFTIIDKEIFRNFHKIFLSSLSFNLYSWLN